MRCQTHANVSVLSNDNDGMKQTDSSVKIFSVGVMHINIYFKGH